MVQAYLINVSSIPNAPTDAQEAWRVLSASSAMSRFYRILSYNIFMNCYQHPNTGTSVSCGRCDRHICPQCMVSTSAGMRCPECAYINRAIPIAAVEPGSKGMSAFAGLLTGLAGAYVLALLTFFQPFLTILAAPLYGRLVADAIKSFSEDDKGRTVEAVGVGSILLGSFIAF